MGPIGFANQRLASLSPPQRLKIGMRQWRGGRYSQGEGFQGKLFVTEKWGVASAGSPIGVRTEVLPLLSPPQRLKIGARPWRGGRYRYTVYPSGFGYLWKILVTEKWAVASVVCESKFGPPLSPTQRL